MKTIVERAYDYADKKWGDVDEYHADTVAVSAYIAGAEEQKAIDEEVRLKKSDDMTQAEYDREIAFANWYHQNVKGTPTYSDAIEWARKDVIDKACEWLKARNVLADASLDGFRKAMEE